MSISETGPQTGVDIRWDWGEIPHRGVISKKAVERMGGRVGLESEPGRSSTFWVELPRATQAQAQTPLPRAA